MNEKEAIKILIELSTYDYVKLENGDEAIETVLNLLEKKDKEIQFQKDINKTEQDRHNKTEKSLKGQIIKQNKIIDEMAEFVNKFDIDEDICMQNKTNPEYCNEDYTNCKECIKQYFESIEYKVEEDK